jgi:hypothetical protein
MTLAAIGYALGAAMLPQGIYAILRVLLTPRAGEDARNLSGSVITRLGTLHALILALMFA